MDPIRAYLQEQGDVLSQETESVEDHLMMYAWTIICNVDSGQWSANQSEEWISAAERWREQYHAYLGVPGYRYTVQVCPICRRQVGGGDLREDLCLEHGEIDSVALVFICDNTHHLLSQKAH